MKPPVGSREDYLEADEAVLDPEVAELPARAEDGRQGAAVAAGGWGRVLEGVRAKEGRDGAEGALDGEAGWCGSAVRVGYVLGGELVVADQREVSAERGGDLEAVGMGVLVGLPPGGGKKGGGLRLGGVRVITEPCLVEGESCRGYVEGGLCHDGVAAHVGVLELDTRAREAGEVGLVAKGTARHAARLVAVCGVGDKGVEIEEGSVLAIAGFAGVMDQRDDPRRLYRLNRAAGQVMARGTVGIHRGNGHRGGERASHEQRRGVAYCGRAVSCCRKGQAAGVLTTRGASTIVSFEGITHGLPRSLQFQD